MDSKVWVFADWVLPDGSGLPAPQLVGELNASTVRNKELFSFSYAPDWLQSPYALPIEQLWRRIVFNIAVSNTDDHLRNHGFILDKQGWRLSPAYDINPVTPAQGLHLNINETENQLDFALALEVIDYFRIKPARAKAIHMEVCASVRHWDKKAKSIGLSRGELERMAQAFRIT